MTKKIFILSILAMGLLTGCFADGNNSAPAVSDISSFEECVDAGNPTEFQESPQDENSLKLCVIGEDVFLEKIKRDDMRIIESDKIGDINYELYTTDLYSHPSYGLIVDGVDYGFIYSGDAFKISKNSFIFWNGNKQLFRDGEYLDRVQYSPKAG